MNQEKVEILNEYIRLGMSPILLEDVPGKIFESAIELDAKCDVSLLNGHYEGADFMPPIWYQQLLETKITPVLLIQNINEIPLNEQTKFVELFKYKKISTFDLPNNCIIIVTATNLSEKPLNEEIYSLMVHI